MSDEGVLEQALRWLNDPLNWTGDHGVPALTGEHLGMSAAAVLAAAAVALPLGVWLGHRGRGSGPVVVVANTTRALPTLALLFIFASSGLGFGNVPTVVAAAVFALPPILANTVTGVAGVATWSFLEYGLHRFLSHDRRTFPNPFASERPASPATSVREKTATEKYS